MRAADPFGDFRLAQQSISADMVVRFGGPHDNAARGRQIIVGYSGWRAFVSGQGDACPFAPPSSGVHAAGAELAACLAGAAAFRFWVERSTLGIAPFQMDLLTLTGSAAFAPGSPLVANSERPAFSILMVGAGSVGSSAAYFLPRLGFGGHLDVVDHDRAEVENLDRSPVFTLDDVAHPKVAAIVEHLRGRGLSAIGYPIRWSEFVTQHPNLLRTHDVWLPLANEYGVRRSIQSNYPPVSFQASTGRNWGVQFGRHIPFVDDCQLDRFPDEPVAPLVCGNGVLPADSGQQIDAALPFTSFTAGLLVAAAVVRMSLGRLCSGPNAALLSFAPKFDLLSYSRRPRAACICTQMLRPVWEKRWGRPAPSCAGSV
jgi:hypothetical protein